MIQRLGHISLICMVLFATTGFVVNKHYMDGELYSASLYSNPESCCIENDLCACCQEESHLVQVDNSLPASGQQTLKPFQQFKAGTLHFAHVKETLSRASYQHPVLKLPHPPEAIHTWLQTFLL